MGKESRPDSLDQQSPLLALDGIDQLETPQLFYYKDYYLPLFSTWAKHFSKQCEYIAGSGLYGFRTKSLGLSGASE